MFSLRKIAIFLFAVLAHGTMAAGLSNEGLLEISAPLPLGEGEFRVFGAVAGNGYPIGMGVIFDGAIFEGAPQEMSDGQWDVVDGAGNVVWPCCGHELDFDVPDNIAAVTAFEHIVINWNPMGHPPPHVYTVPHFDFHFYTMSRAARQAISAPTAAEMCNDNIYGIPEVPLDCDQLDKAMQPLPDDQQPPNHSTVGAVEPAMGNHMVDISSPEFNGQEFTHTFIFGSWKGELTFWEPMITKEFLQSVRHKCFRFDNPAAAPEAGWYPGKYCVQYNPAHDEYAVTLREFEWLPASVAP